MKKSIKEMYESFLGKKIKEAQESNSIQGYYSYTNEGATWLLTRPRSVMEQKRMINLMRRHLVDEFDFEVEKELLDAICSNCQKNKQPVQINSLEYSELELMKKNYIDWILLPLFLSGAKALETYMEQKVNQTGSSNK